MNTSKLTETNLLYSSKKKELPLPNINWKDAHLLQSGAAWRCSPAARVTCEIKSVGLERRKRTHTSLLTSIRKTIRWHGGTNSINYNGERPFQPSADGWLQNSVFVLREILKPAEKTRHNRDKLNQRLSMKNILICGLNASRPQFNLKWNTNPLYGVTRAVSVSEGIKRAGRIKEAGQAGKTLKHFGESPLINDVNWFISDKLHVLKNTTSTFLLQQNI